MQTGEYRLNKIGDRKTRACGDETFPNQKTYSAYGRPRLCQHQTCERRAQFHTPGADAVALRSAAPSETYPANLSVYKNKLGCSSSAQCPAMRAFPVTNLGMHAGISS